MPTQIMGLVSILSTHLALQTENIAQKITQPKRQKIKNDVTKICDEHTTICI